MFSAANFRFSGKLLFQRQTTLFNGKLRFSAAKFRFSGKLLISAACMAKYCKLCIFETLVAFVFLTKLDWNQACTAPHAYHRISHPHQFAALPLLFLAGARSDGQRASNQLEGVISNSGSRQTHRDSAKCTMITPNAWRLCQMRCSIDLLYLLNAKLIYLLQTFIVLR